MYMIIFEIILMVFIVIFILFVIMGILLLIILHVITHQIECKKFPDEEEHFLYDIRKTKDEIEQIIMQVFPYSEHPYLNYHISYKNNIFHVENINKYYLNEHYFIIIDDNDNVFIRCYFYLENKKYNSFKIPILVNKVESRGKINSYFAKKITLINQFGINYQTLKQIYINKYSSSSNFYYYKPITRFFFIGYEHLIRLKP